MHVCVCVCVRARESVWISTCIHAAFDLSVHAKTHFFQFIFQCDCIIKYVRLPTITLSKLSLTLLMPFMTLIVRIHKSIQFHAINQNQLLFDCWMFDKPHLGQRCVRLFLYIKLNSYSKHRISGIINNAVHCKSSHILCKISDDVHS